MLRSVVRTIAAGSVAAAIFACGGSSDGGTTGPTPVFTSVSVAPASPTVNVGGTTTLTATAKDQNGANFGGGTGATWTSSNTARDRQYDDRRGHRRRERQLDDLGIDHYRKYYEFGKSGSHREHAIGQR